jgi:hydrogenase/urease accessory protein HupE
MKSARHRGGLAVRVCLALLGVLAAASASAHDQPYSYLDLDVTPTALEGKVLAHVEDYALALGIAPADTLLGPGMAVKRAPGLQRVLRDRLHLLADGRALVPEWGAADSIPDRKLVGFRFRVPWRSPPGRLAVEGPLFAEDPAHETYLNVTEGGELVVQELLDAAHASITHWQGGRQGWWSVATTFVGEGIRHIFIGPDHVLFVIALLLLGGSIGRLVKIVTAFTLAHSVTLALATLQLVNPPGRVVEPLIALSIVYVGVENLRARDKPRDLRVPIAFGFGLVHGFGFASVLRDFGLPPAAIAPSLVAFNLGVELGQAAIVLAVAPLLGLTRSKAPARGRLVLVGGSLGVIAAGAWWFAERTFLAG